MNCSLDCCCVCGRNKLEALQRLQLRLSFLCYVLYDLCCERAIAKSNEPLLLQEDVHHDFSCLPAYTSLSQEHQHCWHRGSTRLDRLETQQAHKPVAVLLPVVRCAARPEVDLVMIAATQLGSAIRERPDLMMAAVQMYVHLQRQDTADSS